MNPPNSGNRKPATLSMVAKLTNTTANTVSRALNDKGGVSEETRALIKRVAAELNYRPDPFAQSMRGKHSNLIGFLVEDITNHFFVEMLAGAEQEITRTGRSLLIGTSGERVENEEKHVDTFLTYRCAGMVLCLVSPDEETVSRLNAMDARYVVLDAPFDKELECDHFCIDYKSESMKTTAHLLDRGHRRILYLTPEARTQTESARYDGFCQSLSDRGIECPEDLVVKCASGQEAYVETLRLCREQADFTAVYVAKSAFGLGVLSALIAAGKRVPEEVSVIMFGHTEWADVFRPRITCLDRPVFEMGRRGIERLEQRIADPRRIKPERVVLEAELKIGDSVAAIGEPQ